MKERSSEIHWAIISTLMKDLEEQLIEHSCRKILGVIGVMSMRASLVI